MATIVFGVVDWSPDLEQALTLGEVVLGGCLVFPGDPDRCCGDCRHRWLASAGRDSPARHDD